MMMISVAIDFARRVSRNRITIILTLGECNLLEAHQGIFWALFQNILTVLKFFNLYTEGDGRTKAIDDDSAAALDENGDKDAFYADIKKRSTTAWSTDFKEKPHSDAYDLIFKALGDEDVSIKSSYVRIFHPTRPGIDAITNQVFKEFPSWWPPADPPPVTTEDSDSVPNPDCKPWVDDPKPFTKGQGDAIIQQFCENKDYWDIDFVAPVSQTDGNKKAPGASESIDMGGGTTLYAQAYFDEGKCQGSGNPAMGQTDEDKIKYCSDRFGVALNGVGPHLPHPLSRHGSIKARYSGDWLTP